MKIVDIVCSPRKWEIVAESAIKLLGEYSVKKEWLNTMEFGKKIVVEVLFKADYCLPCFFMDAAIQEVLPKYKDRVEYRRVDIMIGKGKKRFLELSCELFGENAVHKHLRLAPVPSLLINGELIFDQIPPQFELVDAIEEALSVLTVKA